MKIRATSIAVLALALPGVLTAAGEPVLTPRDSIATMIEAAHQLLASATEEQRAKLLFELGDDERFELRLAPLPPWGGLRMSEMGLDQVFLVHILLGASLSQQGYAKASGIMALEAYLVELERAQGQVPPVHGIEKYSVALFGRPAPGGSWGWRIQGHHLSLNFVVAEGKVYGSAPAFFGAQPHEVTEGPRAGWHILGDEEELGRSLVLSLTGAQRKVAVIAEQMPRDLFAGDRREYDLGGPLQGIALGDLSAEQQAKLRGLVEEYVANVPDDVSARRRAAVEQGGWENVHFAWIGSTAAGERMYYRVQGPEFLIEYCAVALTPNHVHVIWREKKGDFGADVLGEHLRSSPH